MNIDQVFKNKINSDFNTVDKVSEFMLNAEYKDKNGENFNLYEFIEEACNDIGAEVFEKISNYNQNISDIDYCGLHELYNMAKELNVENLFSYDLQYPTELGKLIDILSISKSRLFTKDNILTEDILNGMSKFLANNENLILDFNGNIITTTISQSDYQEEYFPEYTEYLTTEILRVSKLSLDDTDYDKEVKVDITGTIVSGDLSQIEWQDSVYGTLSGQFDSIYLEETLTERNSDNYVSFDSFEIADGEKVSSDFIKLNDDYKLVIENNTIIKKRILDMFTNETYINFLEYYIEAHLTEMIQPSYVLTEDEYLVQYLASQDNVVEISGNTEIEIVDDLDWYNYEIMFTIITKYLNTPIATRGEDADNYNAVHSKYLVGYNAEETFENADIVEEYKAFMSDIYAAPIGATITEIISSCSIILRNICTRTSYHRDALKLIISKHSEIGTNNSIKKILKEYILRSYTKNEDWLQSTEFDSIGNLSGDLLDNVVSSIFDYTSDFKINIKEYYDTTEYLNINKSISGEGNIPYWADFSDISGDSEVLSGDISGETVIEDTFNTWNWMDSEFVNSSGIVTDITDGNDIFLVSGDAFDLNDFVESQVLDSIDNSEHTPSEVLEFYDQLEIPGNLSGDYDEDNIYDNIPKLEFVNKIYDTFTPDTLSGETYEYWDYKTNEYIVNDLTDMHNKYINNDEDPNSAPNTGHSPAINYKNKQHPSIAAQPFIWNLIEKKIEKGFQNIRVVQLPSDDDSFITEKEYILTDVVDTDGDGDLTNNIGDSTPYKMVYNNLAGDSEKGFYPVGSWRPWNNEYISYVTNYEESINYNYLYTEDTMIDFDGPFKAKSLSKYLDIIEEFGEGDTTIFKAELLSGMLSEYAHIKKYFDIRQTYNGINILNQLVKFKDDIIELQNLQIARFATDSSGNSYILYKKDKYDYKEQGVLWFRYKDHPLPFPLSWSEVIDNDPLTVNDMSQVYLRDEGLNIQEGANKCYDFGIIEDVVYILSSYDYTINGIQQYYDIENEEDYINHIIKYDDFGRPIYKTNINDDYIDSAGDEISGNPHILTLTEAIAAGYVVTEKDEDERVIENTELNIFKIGYEDISEISLISPILSVVHNQDTIPKIISLPSIQQYIGSYLNENTIVFVYMSAFTKTLNGKYSANIKFLFYDLQDLTFKQELEKTITVTNLEYDLINRKDKIWQLAKGEDLLTLSYESLIIDEDDNPIGNGVVSFDISVLTLLETDVLVLNWDNILSEISSTCYRTYITGGAGKDDFSLTNNMFYMDTWYTRMPLLDMPRGYTCSVGVESQSKVFVIGGWGVDENGAQSQLDAISIYSPDEDRWLAMNKTISKVKDAMCAVSVTTESGRGSIVMFGGGSENELKEELNEIEEFDFVTSTVLTGYDQQLILGRRLAIAEFIEKNNEVIIMGGENSDVTSALYLYTTSDPIDFVRDDIESPWLVNLPDGEIVSVWDEDRANLEKHQVYFWDVVERYNTITKVVTAAALSNHAHSASASFAINNSPSVILNKKLEDTNYDEIEMEDVTLMYQLAGYTGNDEDDIIDFNVEFNPDLYTFAEKTSKARVSYPRAYASGASYIGNNKVTSDNITNYGMLLGGSNNDMPSASCEVYDNVFDVWYNQIPMIDRRETHSAATIKKTSATANNIRSESFNSMLLFGGASDTKDDYSSAVSECENYTWIERMSAPYTFANASATSFDADNYVLGGHNDSLMHSTVIQYNSIFNNWLYFSSLTKQIESHSSTSCIKYMPSISGEFSTDFKNSSIFAFNGIQDDYSGNNDIIELDIDLNVTIEHQDVLMETNQSSHAITLFNTNPEEDDNTNLIHVLGGSVYDSNRDPMVPASSIEVTTDHNIFSIDTKTVVDQIKGPAVSAGTVIKLDEDSFILAGGFTTGNLNIFRGEFDELLDSDDGLSKNSHIYRELEGVWTSEVEVGVSIEIPDEYSIYGNGINYKGSPTLIGGVKERTGSSGFVQEFKRSENVWVVNDIMPVSNRSFGLTVNNIEFPKNEMAGFRFKTYELIASNSVKSWVAELLPSNYKEFGDKYSKYLNKGIWYAGQHGSVGGKDKMTVDNTIYNGSFFDRVFRQDDGYDMGVKAPLAKVINGIQFNDDCFYLTNLTTELPQYSLDKDPASDDSLNWATEAMTLATYSYNDTESLKQHLDDEIIKKEITSVNTGKQIMPLQFNYLLESDLKQPLVLNNNILTFSPGQKIKQDYITSEYPLVNRNGVCNPGNPYSVNVQTQQAKNIYNNEYETELTEDYILNGIRQYENIGRNRGSFWLSYKFLDNSNIQNFELVELINSFYKFQDGAVNSGGSGGNGSSGNGGTGGSGSTSGGYHKSNIFSIEIVGSLLNENIDEPFDLDETGLSDDEIAANLLIRQSIKTEVHNIIKEAIINIIKKLAPVSTQLWKVEFKGS